MYTTDIHLRDNVPSCRIDDFYNVQFNKIKEIVRIFKEEEIDYWINGGDLFDTYDPSHSIVNEFTSIIDPLQQPIYTICGSHDMLGYNMDLIHKTAMGNLLMNGYVKLLGKDLLLFRKYDRIVSIKGIHARKKLDYADYAIDGTGTSIIVTHDPIVIKPVIYEHMLISDVAKATNANFVLCAHIHTQFDMAERLSRFINPGPMSRQTTLEMELKPKVCILEV